MNKPRTTRILGPLAAALLLAGCVGAPAYQEPGMALPAEWKADPGWSIATPADRLEREDWWTLFGDPELTRLIEQANEANQEIALASANYRQARAALRTERSNLFPSVDLSAAGSKTGTFDGGSADTDSGNDNSGNYQIGIGASWEPDLFGRISGAVSSAKASEQAAQIDIASVRLAVQGELATAYFNLRETEAEIALVSDVVDGYQRSLTIVTNRYNAGIIARTDVYQAQSTLSSAQSTLEGLKQQRRTYENAIAVLVGEPASSFSLPAGEWVRTVPSVPVGLPSELLQRRPDIAEAERQVAAANAEIGVARAAFYPSITLTGDAGANANALGDLFSVSNLLWSLGASLAQTIFDGGANAAQLESARAGYDGSVATYRQTVLVAFQDVEDQLIAADVLARQQAFLQQASEAAIGTERTQMNQYEAGLIDYTDVVAAQATALSARRSLVQAEVDRQTAAVALIQAIGGGWSGE